MPQFEHFLEIAENLKRTTDNPILNQGPLNIWTEYLVAQILPFFDLLQILPSYNNLRVRLKACF